MTNNEIARVQSYLRKTFRLDTIRVRKRPKKDDSAEVYIGDEFIAIIFRDDEDGDLSYHFEMSILELDLEQA